MTCFSVAHVCSALRSARRSVRNAFITNREVYEAKQAARARVGRLPVEGRYHQLPRRLEDDYDLEEGKLLGSGFNGAVVLAKNRRTGVAYAVKSFGTAFLSDAQKQMLASEVGTYLSMDHPHVVRLMEVYESETEISMVMECCTGGELLERLEAKNVFTEEEAAETIWQMLLAVSYLHGEGVVHRDLKLENFLYEQQDGHFLKLIDFGFSKFCPELQEMSESCGTIFYIAPEVLNKSYAGCSCDMWSLGVIAFVLLSGYMPFDGKTDRDIVRAVRSGKFTMHAARWSHISESAKDFVKQLLVAKPCDRMTAQQAMQHPWLAARSRSPSLDTSTPSWCSPSTSTSPSPCAESPLSVSAGDVAGAFLSFARATRFQQACMQMMAWSLPLEERKLLRGTFLEMDASHTGVFTLPQLNQLLGEKYNMSESECEAVCKAMTVLDVDQDGELHYSDFLAVMMAPRLTRNERDVVEEAFRRFDLKGAGYLTEEGLRRTLKEEVPSSELQHVFRLLDTDKDGKIYLQDFVAYLHKAMAASSAPFEAGSGTGGCFARAGA